MLTKLFSLRQVSCSLTAKRKIVLWLLVAIVSTLPLCLGLERVLTRHAETSRLSPDPLPVTSAANSHDRGRSPGLPEPREVPGSNREQSLEAYGQLPLAFEANRGQSDEQVKFISRGSGYGLFLTPTEAVLALRQPATQSKKIGDRATLVTGSKQTRDAVLRLKLVGANTAPRVLGMEELPGKVNYFIGNDPTKWRTDVPTYAKVKYQDVYPGVDMIYYGNKRELEYDLVVAPGADPDVIALRVEGSKALRLDRQGDLVLKMAGGTVILRKPDIYQEINGNRQTIQGGYTLQSPHQIGFEVGDYDTSRPLVIDPVVLVYSTLLGGNNDDMALAIAVDSGNNAYVTGRTFSNNFPTVNPYQPIFGGGFEDAFVTKIAIQAAATCVEPPNTTMIAWYPFDETVGTTAANLATGNTGTLVNAPIHIPGKVAGALLFNGINDYVSSPSTIVTNIGPAGLPQTCGGYSTCRGDFSIDAWIKVNSKGSMSVSTIVDKRSGSGSTTKGYSFFVFQQNKLGLHLADGLGIPGFTNYLSPVITGLADKWHHVAVTVSRRSPTGIQWYDNGVNMGFSDPTVAATSRYGSLANNGPLHIGAANPLSSWFQGEIDELEIFNRALDASEVKAIFDAGDYGKCKK